jgi:hypothetical protein
MVTGLQDMLRVCHTLPMYLDGTKPLSYRCYTDPLRGATGALADLARRSYTGAQLFGDRYWYGRATVSHR